MSIKPLTEEQIKELKKEHDGKTGRTRIARFMHARKSIDVVTGALIGGNVMYQKVYWSQTAACYRAILKFLRENNPGKKIRIQYSE